MAATKAQQESFINEIGPLIQREGKARGYKIVSTVIAQACLESGWGLSKLGAIYHNYFGMKCGDHWKGASVNMGTNEEYVQGQLTPIRDNFRVYNNITARATGSPVPSPCRRGSCFHARAGGLRAARLFAFPRH